MENLCYDCGKPIKLEDEDKEHIPAKCLFNGFSDEFKLKRLTVPAHKICNNNYSKIDQELRDAIGIMTNNHTNNVALTSKAIRSILRKKDGIERISSKNGTNYVDFNFNNLKDLHIKNFRGIFYNSYKIPLPEQFELEIVSVGDDDKISFEEVHKLYHAINDNFPKWEISGHPDIFKYKIIVFDNNTFCDFKINSNEQTVFSIMVYNQEIICIVVAATEKMIGKFRKK